MNFTGKKTGKGNLIKRFVDKARKQQDVNVQNAQDFLPIVGLVEYGKELKSIKDLSPTGAWKKKCSTC